jgi:hypothetical protein
MLNDVRRFTDRGIEQFEVQIDLSGGGEKPADFREAAKAIKGMLKDSSLTKEAIKERPFKVRRFDSRWDAAHFFLELLEPLKGACSGIERDRGLWTWLTASFWEEITKEANGTRKIGERARHVLQSDWSDYHRHLLAGPYGLLINHEDDPERLRAALANAVESPGDVVAQITGTQYLVSSKSVLEVFTSLYYDEGAKQNKRHAAGKGPGSARRLADVLGQLQLTYDIHRMPSDQILKLLPSEFDKFRLK